MTMNKKHYGSIDGLRALSCVGIMMMHILANTKYSIPNYFFTTIIPFFTHFVVLFLMISGFGISAGYLSKFETNEIDLETFYKKRYSKLLPFFIFLLLIAFIIEPSITNFYDSTLEVTLLYGLLPNNSLNVIGVSWTLGVIFLFYLLFPALSVMLRNKKRAWFLFLVSLWIVFIAENYYFTEVFVISSFTPRHSFLYCLPYFLSGCLIYLYCEELEFIIKTRIGKIFYLIFVIIITVIYFILGNKTFLFFKNLILFSVWLSFAVSHEIKILSNKFMKFLGDISFEIYLCHMFVFRTYERLHIIERLPGVFGYLFLVVIVLLGSICLVKTFNLCYNYILNTIIDKYKRSKS